jgi:hypothetical protein
MRNCMNCAWAACSKYGLPREACLKYVCDMAVEQRRDERKKRLENETYPKNMA